MQIQISRHGDQRRMHIQLVTNKRRIKRRKKKRKKSTLPLVDRVQYVFENGAIADYTHPKEVDPFWGVLYKQYEYLVYTDIIYRNTLKNIDHELTDEELESIIQDLTLIAIHKKKLTSYMMNFMNVLYGSVIQSRFYGWKIYLDDFISKFNEVAIVSIRKLRFDANQTLCSVYFYQAFWLSGLSIINKISDDLKKKYSDDSELNRGSAALSVDNEEDFDTLFQDKSLDELGGMGNLDGGAVPSTEELNEHNKATFHDALFEPGAEVDVLANDCDGDFEVFCSLKKLLHQLCISIDDIYIMSDRNINKLGKSIRKELHKGNIVLSEIEHIRIKALFSRVS